MFCVLVQDLPNIFPKIDAISDQFVCKRIEAYIEGEEGHFYGSICKVTDSPDGYGVFKTGDWVHCGKVERSHFTDGRKVSINSESKVLKLVSIKGQADGAVFEKVEKYSVEGVVWSLDCSFLING